MARTVLVHLNVELPDDAPATADDVAAEVQAAIEVAAEGDHTPALTIGTTVVALAEEIDGPAPMQAVTAVFRWPDSGNDSAEAERRGLLTERIGDVFDSFADMECEIHPEDLTSGEGS